MDENKEQSKPSPAFEGSDEFQKGPDPFGDVIDEGSFDQAQPPPAVPAARETVPGSGDPQCILVAPQGPLAFKRPMGLAFGRLGTLYVSDLLNGRIRRLPPRQEEPAKALVDMQLAGTLPGMPWSVTLDGKGRLYVADTSSHQILVYDGQGRFLHAIGPLGRIAN